MDSITSFNYYSRMNLMGVHWPPDPTSFGSVYAQNIKRDMVLEAVTEEARVAAKELVECSFGDTLLESIGFVYQNKVALDNSIILCTLVDTFNFTPLQGEQYLGFEEGFLGLAGAAAAAEGKSHAAMSQVMVMIVK